ncbi:GntR family transcriptional regulator [Arthrobacter crystallopoietes]|uniref:GntR family transcriptional regulator n=1 Tax=Crystallibacter crystallopoietes TaxID=37928 RepID=UPI001111438F|nr:GntR family transcriptional regulator [Arthrobacter crystallopoietes]QTG81336.1 GntR family transcriptional regulator [Arthrobacter crystallopoietes]
MAKNRFIEPLVQESTPAIIARKLRYAIGHGELEPGQQLGEADLARELGVSRGPLREAMQRLTQEGLLVSIRNRGIFVTELGPSDIEDMYLARTAVERAAGLKIIELEGSHREVSAALREVTDRMARAVAAGEHGARLSDLDIEFHELLVAMAQSSRLSRMHNTLITETRMCMAALEDTGYTPEARLAEHEAIADAIGNADVPRFHKLLADHMDDAVEKISRSMIVAAAADAGETLETYDDDTAPPAVRAAEPVGAAVPALEQAAG